MKPIVDRLGLPEFPTTLGDVWTGVTKPAADDLAAIAAMLGLDPSGPSLLARAVEHRVIEPGELPAVIDAIDEARNGPPPVEMDAEDGANSIAGCPRNECQIRTTCTRPTLCLSSAARAALQASADADARAAQHLAAKMAGCEHAVRDYDALRAERDRLRRQLDDATARIKAFEAQKADRDKHHDANLALSLLGVFPHVPVDEDGGIAIRADIRADVAQLREALENAESRHAALVGAMETASEEIRLRALAIVDKHVCPTHDRTNSTWNSLSWIDNALAERDATIADLRRQLEDLRAQDTTARRVFELARRIPFPMTVERSAFDDAVIELIRAARGDAPVSPPLEVRHDDRGMLDEVVAHNSFVHLERMDRHHVWLGITTPDGKTLHVDLFAEIPPRRKRPVIRVETRSDP